MAWHVMSIFLIHIDTILKINMQFKVRYTVVTKRKIEYTEKPTFNIKPNGHFKAA